MKRKTSLPLAKPAQSGLGLPTIMDRDIAAAHGSAYVHLVVFCIDVDRVYWLDPEDSGLPFGWEVFITEFYLLAWAHAHPDCFAEVVEAVCAPLLEETPGEPPLGGQVAFATYDAIARGALPRELTALFSSWRSPPRELVSELSALHADAAATAERLATYCLSADVEPPLAPPTREALERIRTGELRPPSPDEAAAPRPA